MRAKPDVKTRPYEEAAEYRQVTIGGWVCKTCGQVYQGDSATEEHIARYCCAKDFPCECGGRHEKPWTHCSVCRERKDAERYAARERKEWDGKAMLYSDRHDKYFTDPAEAMEVLADELDRELTDQDIEDARLLICEPNNGNWFSMAEHLCDDLGEDGECNFDARDIDRIVNEWIKAHAPFSWTPGKFALKLSRS